MALRSKFMVKSLKRLKKIHQYPFCWSTGLHISDASWNTLAGMLFDATAILVLMFKISFSTSFRFTSLNSKRALRLNFSVIATILEWFSYFLIPISNGSEYPTLFEMLLHALMSSFSFAFPKKLLISSTFWSTKIMASFSIRAILVGLEALLERKGVIVLQNALLSVISFILILG